MIGVWLTITLLLAIIWWACEVNTEAEHEKLYVAPWER